MIINIIDEEVEYKLYIIDYRYQICGSGFYIYYLYPNQII